MSYCVVCDSTVEPCPEHPTVRRYLDPIVYERIERAWGVPEGERTRWDNPAPVERRAAGATRPIQHLVVELEAWVFLSESLEATVRAAYKANAMRTTRLIEKVVAGAQEQSLKNPEGYLAKHAAGIA